MTTKFDWVGVYIVFNRMTHCSSLVKVINTKSGEKSLRVFALLGNAYLCKSQSSRVIHWHCSVLLGDLRCPEPTQDALCICPAMNSLFWSQFWRRSLSLLEPLVPVKTLSKLFAESILLLCFFFTYVLCCALDATSLCSSHERHPHKYNPGLSSQNPLNLLSTHRHLNVSTINNKQRHEDHNNDKKLPLIVFHVKFARALL